MTVEELIKKLEQCSNDTEVKFWSGLEPAHELGTMELDTEKNILYINDASCLDLDDYIYIEE